MAGIVAFLQQGTMSIEMKKLYSDRIVNSSRLMNGGNGAVKPAYSVKKVSRWLNAVQSIVCDILLDLKRVESVKACAV